MHSSQPPAVSDSADAAASARAPPPAPPLLPDRAATSLPIPARYHPLLLFCPRTHSLGSCCSSRLRRGRRARGVAWWPARGAPSREPRPPGPRPRLLRPRWAGSTTSTSRASASSAPCPPPSPPSTCCRTSASRPTRSPARSPPSAAWRPSATPTSTTTPSPPSPRTSSTASTASRRSASTTTRSCQSISVVLLLPLPRPLLPLYSSSTSVVLPFHITSQVVVCRHCTSISSPCMVKVTRPWREKLLPIADGADRHREGRKHIRSPMYARGLYASVAVNRRFCKNMTCRLNVYDMCFDTVYVVLMCLLPIFREE
ncbi:unnamed protein product [Triticum turgidum subsp. durum]|uniref:Uncharacterized protein n=1 Tax=Triticum turgidum subsp. durum TaxID=4567 RepID=A0A9R1Q500_TRITD|nr:unnamed protein product [Triticum turgidum subsp. durum]